MVLIILILTMYLYNIGISYIFCWCMAFLEYYRNRKCNPKTVTYQTMDFVNHSTPNVQVFIKFCLVISCHKNRLQHDWHLKSGLVAIPWKQYIEWSVLCVLTLQKENINCQSGNTNNKKRGISSPVFMELDILWSIIGFPSHVCIPGQGQ